MTNKKAVEKLREEFCKLKPFCELYPDACRKEECEIYLSIKALEGKDTNVPSNDTISRTDAIDAVAYAQDGKDAQRILGQLPPAQPEYLHVIMGKIRKNYEKAMNVSYINDPMAVALSETWKEYVDEKDHKRG